MSTKITILSDIQAPIETVWKLYNDPAAMNEWNHASEDWAAKDSKVDLHEGGSFASTMYAKDGSFEFTFGATYTEVVVNELIRYKMDDGREAEVKFETLTKNTTRVIIIFDAEDRNPVEMQQAGWQAILDNFRKIVENNED